MLLKTLYYYELFVSFYHSKEIQYSSGLASDLSLSNAAINKNGFRNKFHFVCISNFELRQVQKYKYRHLDQMTATPDLYLIAFKRILMTL